LAATLDPAFVPSADLSASHAAIHSTVLAATFEPPLVPSADLSASHGAGNSKRLAATLEPPAVPSVDSLPSHSTPGWVAFIETEFRVASVWAVSSISFSNSPLFAALVDLSNPDAEGSGSFGVGLWAGIGVGAFILVVSVGVSVFAVFLRSGRRTGSFREGTELDESSDWRAKCRDGFVSNANATWSDHPLHMSLILSSPSHWTHSNESSDSLASFPDGLYRT
jgi:hypothetical protein